MEELKNIEASVKSATVAIDSMKAANEAAIADVKDRKSTRLNSSHT